MLPRRVASRETSSGMRVAMMTGRVEQPPDFRQYVCVKEGLMRLRMLVGVFLLVAVAGAGTLVARGNSYVSSDKQWTIINIPSPVLVKNQYVMGEVLIVHDSAKMARGEPCTTFYRFDPASGPKEALVSFHCRPRQTDKLAETTIATVVTEPDCRRLVEYQIAGDTEAHGVPIR
jgi:hypothetical protein